MEKTYSKPYLIEFPKVGDPTMGYISIAEFEKNLPFEVKRTFWTYFTPESVVRGRHAHHVTEQILVAVAGRIIVNTEMRDGEIQTFILEKPNQGVYIPPTAWHTMQYSHNAVQLAFASTVYTPDDYIRDFDEFRNGK
jgi:dTDP-4-dehydrorhamnose 3,5-epimerase-like enzyme